MEQEVQIHELPEREVPVGQDGQGRALVGDRRDAVRSEQVEDLEQLRRS